MVTEVTSRERRDGMMGDSLQGVSFGCAVAPVGAGSTVASAALMALAAAPAVHDASPRG